MAELAMRSLACPACGGQMSAPDRGVARCGFCSSQVLVYESGVRKVGVYTLAPTVSEAEARALVVAKLQEAGFSPVPPLVASTGSQGYLVRRGRVRVTWGAMGEVREGWFGVPWSDGAGGVVFFDDPERLVPAEKDAPAGLASEVLAFEDTFQQRYPRDDAAREGRGMPLRVEHATWTDELFVVDVPVTSFAFAAPRLRSSLTRMWYGRSDDGRYSVWVDRADGRLLLFRAPRRGPNIVTLTGCFLAMVFGPTVVGLGLGGIGALIGVLASVLGALVAAVAPHVR